MGVLQFGQEEKREMKIRTPRYFYSMIQKMIECLHRKDLGVNIFMFHQVDDEKKAWNDYNVCITKSGFLRFLEGLEDESCQFISVDALNEIQNHENGKKVVLTFDDIFQDAYKNAFPILIEKNIPFCVFIAENYIDKPGYITSDELEQLSQQPLCTIGYHTKNHGMMRTLSSSEIEYELDCHDFARRIGNRIRYFAFPYGSVYACSLKSIQAAAEQPYALVFSTISTACTKKWMKKKYKFIPRININEDNFRKILEKL